MALEITHQKFQQSFFSILLNRMEDGGLFVMSLTLICGLLALILAVNGIWLVKQNSLKINRNIILINSIGLFALVLGVFGQLLKLIETLDELHFTEGVMPSDLAGGLKFTMLPTLVGCLIFLISRFSTIVLNWYKSTANL